MPPALRNLYRSGPYISINPTLHDPYSVTRFHGVTYTTGHASRGVTAMG